MNSFFIYLLEVSGASAILYFGFLILSKNTSVKFRRLYLLSCLLMSAAIPFSGLHLSSPLTVSFHEEPRASSFIATSSPVTSPVSTASMDEATEIATAALPVEQVSSVETGDILLFVYLIGVIFFLVRIGISMYGVYRLMKSAEKVDGEFSSFFIVDKEAFTGASFFQLIFIGKSLLNTSKESIIYRHEQVHATRWHSLDLLLSEVYTAVFWLNPIGWLIKSQIRLNTEYEADEAMMSHVDRKAYSHMLIDLSSTLYYERVSNFFSAKSVKRRIESLHTFREHKFYRGLVWTSLFYALAFLLIACVEPWEGSRSADPVKAMENIKTVTTRFTSHQSDTQDKDDRVIAVAYYHPDGTIDRVDQHMTYPYNYKNPFRREFWTEPDPINVPLVMDGLELGNAENNILYGNDWPVKYWDYVKNGHPKMKTHSEIFTYNVSVERGQFDLPVKIFTTETGLNEDAIANRHVFYNNKEAPLRLFKGYEEEFEYNDGKVTRYLASYIPDEAAEEIFGKNGVVEKGDGVVYVYENNNLSRVTYSDRVYQFAYEGGLLTRTEYYIKENMYNYREHFYSAEGLRTRTEIYNLYKELEFTIDYDYEFYEDQ
ncbi:M56 family metallopeptidase [Imperialibacter roseus]|uniref:M56 family metallopeptidase n=1 Tax=Imperialibacter roseus TaxID=1324217 RepID=A0ABZ0IKJ3_9BACT|nr:M56 family metallopeptidase [Imperialibacter roseus]WOK05052.1 M56 family metallopeptidase [Imperialibacter roseus]